MTNQNINQNIDFSLNFPAQYAKENALTEILACWQEPHRYFHTLSHLADILQEIEKDFLQEHISPDEKELFQICAFMHDIVYNPKKQDNEAQSAELVSHFFPKLSTELVAQIQNIILETKTHQSTNRFSEIFCAYDMRIITHSTLAELWEYERQIFKEFQYLDYAMYKAGRIFLLENFAKKHPQNTQNLLSLVEILKVYRPKIAVYPGSFNPFHKGHLNIIEKAEKIFDKVIIARGTNPDKNAPILASLDIKALAYKQVDSFVGFLTDYTQTKENFADITIVKGLRNGDDLDYEVNQLRFMEEMYPQVRLMFINCDREFEHISSSAIRNLDKIKSDFSQKYLP